MADQRALTLPNSNIANRSLSPNILHIVFMSWWLESFGSRLNSHVRGRLLRILRHQPHQVGHASGLPQVRFECKNRYQCLGT